MEQAKRIVIVGGRLQGTEAAYLAKKAGLHSILIEKTENTPASGLVDEVFIFDVTKKESKMISLLKSVDMVLPALENDEVLNALTELRDEYGFKLAFDLEAYNISKSKIISDELIHRACLPAPQYYPEGEAPYVLKPSGESGSTGVRRAETKNDVEDFLKSVEKPNDWVVQEFLEGPSYSIEVVGNPGNYRAYAVTEIHMDRVYDCCRVTSPCPLVGDRSSEMEDLVIKLAELVNLHGIMDLEVIDAHTKTGKPVFKILEIDARIPSQTPAVVYHSMGMNLLTELMDLTVTGDFKSVKVDKGRFCSYEHYRVGRKGSYEAHGEHMMGELGPLKFRSDFFGADEVISDYGIEKEYWHGTFINWGLTLEELEKKRERMLSFLRKGELNV